MLQIKLQTSSITQKQIQMKNQNASSSEQFIKMKKFEPDVLERENDQSKFKSGVGKKQSALGKEASKERQFIRQNKERLREKRESVNERQQLKALQSRKKQSQSQPTTELIEEDLPQSQDQQEEKTSKIKVRVVGGIILLLLVTMAVVHGFTSVVDAPFFNSSNNAMVGASAMMAAIFVILGFGLTLGYYGQNIFSSFLIVLYVVSSTIIISPFLVKFWINLFTGTFFDNAGLPISNSGITIAMTSNNVSGVDINYWNIKLSLSCAISQLIIYFATISKLQIYKVVVSSLFFLLNWTLNFALVLSLFTTSTESRINDDFNICFVYLYGGFAGLIVVFDAPSKILVRSSESYQPKYPKSFSLIGVFFMWMSFAFTYSIIGRKDSGQSSDSQTDYFRLVFYPEGCLGMFFALSSSVLSTAATSIIFTKGNTLKLSDFLGSTISGAIMFGPVAGYTQNLSIPITLGIASGVLSTAYKCKILPLVNRKYLIDSLGFLGPFFIIPILGNFLVTPIVASIHSSASLITPQLYSTAIQKATSSYLLLFFLISSGLGVICGMMLSWVMRVFKGNENTYGDRLMFSQDLSLVEMKLDYEENSTDLFSSESSKQEQSSESKKKAQRKSSAKKRAQRGQSL